MRPKIRALFLGGVGSLGGVPLDGQKYPWGLTFSLTCLVEDHVDQDYQFFFPGKKSPKASPTGPGGPGEAVHSSHFSWFFCGSSDLS